MKAKQKINIRNKNSNLGSTYERDGEHEIFVLFLLGCLTPYIMLSNSIYFSEHLIFFLFYRICTTSSVSIHQLMGGPSVSHTSHMNTYYCQPLWNLDFFVSHLNLSWMFDFLLATCLPPWLLFLIFIFTRLPVATPISILILVNQGLGKRFCPDTWSPWSSLFLLAGVFRAQCAVNVQAVLASVLLCIGLVMDFSSAGDALRGCALFKGSLLP